MRAHSPWGYCYAGPDMLRYRGWIACLRLLPRRDLMRRDEEGTLTLCGLAITVRGWPLRVECRSDANEITTRIARAAGVEVMEIPK